MKKILALLLLSLSALTFLQAQVLRKRHTKLMGGRFEITVVDKDTASADRDIDDIVTEISRIENLISDWMPTTMVSLINQQAGVQPVKVTAELFALTKRALEWSAKTGGTFDISFAAMERVWKFDGSMTELPGEEAIKKSVAKVGYRHILLNENDTTIFLELTGMKIGFGALGEGYAADRCRDMMRARGVEAGIVNATGDMSTWGKKPDGSAWNIGINNPFDQNALVAIVPLKEMSVTTSGSYEKFALINGKRYAHIINPATGWPATGLCSVTVFGPSTETANVFSTSIMVLGEKAGLVLLRKYPGYSCLLITDTGKVIRSRNLHIPKTKKQLSNNR